MARLNNIEINILWEMIKNGRKLWFRYDHKILCQKQKATRKSDTGDIEMKTHDIEMGETTENRDFLKRTTQVTDPEQERDESIESSK